MNVPLVPGVPLPQELQAIPQGRVVGLTIQADRLQEIRAYRLKRLGATGTADSYSDMGRILDELAYADDIFRAPPPLAGAGRDRPQHRGDRRARAGSRVREGTGGLIGPRARLHPLHSVFRILIRA